MRDYTRIAPQFWTGETGRALRKNPDAQRLAFYLLSCPGSNMIGLFYVAGPTICHEVGLAEKDLPKLWAFLASVEFAYYDADRDMVWVPNMARIQLDDALKPGDRRVTQVVRQLDSVRRHPFAKRFWDRYALAFSLLEHPEAAGLAKLFCTPSDGEIEAFASLHMGNTPSWEDQDQEEEQEKAKAQEQAEDCAETGGPALAPLAVLTFPCSGLPKAWGLTAGQISEWTELYPAADVIAECRKALGWIQANPTKRKTSRGMAAFLARWLGKCQDRGGHAPIARAGPGARSDGNLDALGNWLEKGTAAG